MYESELNSQVGDILFLLANPTYYTITCMDSAPTLILPSYDQDLWWSIAKNSTAFTIAINGSELLAFEFSTSAKCQTTYGGDVVDYVQFFSDDTASKFYRSGVAPIEPGI